MIKHFAKMMGVTQKSAQSWLNGHVPNTEHLYRIAIHYNVSIDWLLGIKEDMEFIPVKRYDNNTMMLGSKAHKIEP